MFIKISTVNSTVDTGNLNGLSGIKQFPISLGGIPECKLNFPFDFSKNGGCIVYTSRFMEVL